MRILFFLIFICSELFYCQENATKIIIKSIDFSINTVVDVDCYEFDHPEFKDCKTITIYDHYTIDKICKYLKEFKIDTLSRYLPDTRAKIYLEYNMKNDDIICLSNVAMSYNCRPILFNKKFLILIKDIIKKNHRNY